MKIVTHEALFFDNLCTFERQNSLPLPLCVKLGGYQHPRLLLFLALSRYILIGLENVYKSGTIFQSQACIKSDIHGRTLSYLHQPSPLQLKYQTFHSLEASILTNPPPSSWYSLPLLQPVQLSRTFSPPTPGARFWLLHASESGTARPGDPTRPTAGLCSYPCSSSSSCESTGVQHASLPANICSHSGLVFSEKRLRKVSLRAGQVVRLSRVVSRL